MWIDLREPSRVTLYLAGNKADRLLVRHVPLVDRIDEVAREEIAHIVEATVDALLIGGRLGVVTDESAGRRQRLHVPERPKGVSLDVGLGYATQMWSSSSQPFLHGPAIFVGMAGRAGTVRPGVWMSGELRFPTTIEGDPISTRLDQGAVRALGTADWAVSRRWVLRAGLGGGVDWVHIAPESKDGAKVDLQAPHFATVPMLRLLLSARYLFTSKSELFAGVAGDFDCFNTRYLVQRESGDDVIFHPWRLRPMAVLGIASDVLARLGPVPLWLVGSTIALACSASPGDQILGRVVSDKAAPIVVSDAGVSSTDATIGDCDSYRSLGKGHRLRLLRPYRSISSRCKIPTSTSGSSW